MQFSDGFLAFFFYHSNYYRDIIDPFLLVHLFVILTQSCLIFLTMTSIITKPSCMHLNISSSQCLRINWRIPYWNNTFQLHRILI